MAIGTPPNAPRGSEGSKGAAGRYGFVAEVARGYLGTLFVARDPADSSERGTVFVRHVVPIATSSTKSALLEAARWAHATGAPLLEVLENRNGVDVVTAYSDVEPLRALLRTAALKHTTVEPGIILGVVGGLIEQLDAAHDAATGQKSPFGFGGVHPDSILVGTDGHVELIDCGIGAAASAREPWRSDPQRVGYSAPEQVDPKGVLDGRTDVFSLGILLWEAFANKRLFPAVDAKSARDRVLKGTIARLDATKGTASAPPVSKEIADFVAKALERDPAARFQNVEEMEAALKALGPAKPEALGAWVTTLGEQAIAKRKQILERASGAPVEAPNSARPSVPPKARVSVPPGIGSSTVPAKTPSVPKMEAVRPPPKAPSVPKMEAVRPPAKVDPAVTPKAPDVTSPTPQVPGATAAPSHDEGLDAAPPSVKKAPEEPAPSSAPTERSVAPPAVETPAPVSVEAISAVESAPAPTPPAAPPAAAEPQAVGGTEEAPESSAPTQPSAVEPVPTRAAETAAAKPDAAAEGPESDEDDAMDVSDDELGSTPLASPAPDDASISARPPPRSSLPPKLPPSEAIPSPAILNAPGEPLASPFGGPSDFTRLTRAPEKKRRPVVIIAAAFIGSLAIGFFVLGRVRKKEPIRVPYKEEAVAGSVQIVAQEPLSSASASASAAPAARAAEPPPSASAAPAETAPPAPEPPPPEKEPTPPAAAGQTTGGTASGSSVGNATPSGGTLHKPPPSKGPVNAGYKPGGI